MGKVFDLFMAIYGRAPFSQQEFDNFCRIYKLAEYSENSRRVIK